MKKARNQIMSLKEYQRKRKFSSTPEPRGKTPRGQKGDLRFVVQKHEASRLHYDFRLEFDGTLKSWAVPKGPSLTSQDPRLAMFVEDHPLEYGKFEGVIPKGNYGAGTVMLWDAGTFIERNSSNRKQSEAAMREGLAKGHLTFILSGQKLRGEFALVRLKSKNAEDNAWLLIKKHDAEATRVDVLKQDRSVATGRSMKEIAIQAQKKNEVWLPGKGKKQTATLQTIKDEPVRTKRSKQTQVEMPRRIRPMEPIFSGRAPEGSGWLFSEFGAGIRAIAHVDKSTASLLSRGLLPMEKKYPEIVAALKKIGADRGESILDGEIVRDGKEISFVIHDVIFQSGKDLRETSLTERLEQLKKLKVMAPLQIATIAKTPHKVPFISRSPMIVAKKADSHYRSGLSKDWLRFRPKANKSSVQTDRPPITHPNKIFFPEVGYTKGDLAEYYASIADVMMPYLVDRPQSLHRQPDGIKSTGFFHKDMSSFLPRRVQTERIFSESTRKTVNYALIQDAWSLLYLVNLGCIELNPWLSRRENLDKPDLIVIDLDPDDNNKFTDVINVAREVHRILESVGAKSFPKTSGATGIHICIPTGGQYDYEIGREFAEAVCKIVQKKFPKLTSVERSPAKRRGKIYLDFMQNARGQTLAAPYCVRPKPKATVSAPLRWTEVNAKLRPEQFTIKNMIQRLRRVGDLWSPLLKTAVDIASCRRKLSKRFHI